MFRFLLIFSLAALGYPALSAAQPTKPISQLVVYPEVIHVGASYPARVIVGIHGEEGRWTDLSFASDLKAECVDPNIARRDSDGSIRAVHDGTTELLIQYGGQEVRRAVVVHANQSPTFFREVSSVLSRSGCNVGTCHGNLHGKGGFRLSLRGDDPWQDFSAIVHDSNARRLDFFSPSDSLLLQKPSMKVAHQGGEKLPEGSLEQRWLRDWIELGAMWRPGEPNPSKAPDEAIRMVDHLEVFPAEAWLVPPQRRQPLVVIAVELDGSRRDVTRWARLEASDLSRIQITNDGVIEASGPIETTISISYLDARASSRMVFLPSAKLEEEQELFQGSVSPIDRLIEKRLHAMQLRFQEEADSWTLLRRLFLVTLGRLPSQEEMVAWERDELPNRTSRWIDRLLADPFFDWMWAMHWSDVLRNEPKVMSRKGAILWNRWLRDQSSADRPLNEMVQDLVASTGSTYDNPPASFHRTHRDATQAAESIGQVFLGVRLQCAKCHNHPFDRWKQDDYYGLAAYFTSVDRKQIDNKPADGLDTHVITGDEIISLSQERSPSILHPGRSREVFPRPLSIEPTSSDSVESTSTVSRSPEQNPLAACGAWLAHGNRQFARNMANRIWYHYWGRGIVDPPDDFRDSNPASNPELLEYLTDELIRSNYSVRHLSRMILESRAFSASSLGGESSSDSLPGVPVFAGYGVRRLQAEVLLDAVSDVCMISSDFSKGKSEAKDEGGLGQELEAMQRRAITVAPNPKGSPFLKAFGKPERTLVCECERSTDASLSQSLLMLNGDEVRKKVSDRSNRLEGLRKSETSVAIDTLFMTALTRHPTAEESDRMTEYLENSPDRRTALEDLLWALLNSKEFTLLR